MNNSIRRIISVVLAVAVCLSCFTAFTANTAAADYSITVTGLSYPQAGTTPQGPTGFSSSVSYELVGWWWEESNGDETYMTPEDLKNFYIDNAQAYGMSIWEDLLSFRHTHKYKFNAMYRLKNVSVNVEVPFVIKDKSGNTISDGNGQMISVSMMSSMGVNVPSSIASSGDSLLMLGTDSMISSTASHQHDENGGYVCDGKYHYKTCSVCGTKIFASKSKHWTYSDNNQKFTVVKDATDTEDGLWEYRCNTCGYALDSVTVPAKSKQTIVNNYDELRDALARGGKQWITLKFSNSNYKIYQTEDVLRDNMLTVDDPSADITIDLNGGFIVRETTHDKSLFNIKAGSLRIIQKEQYKPFNNKTDNLSFFSGNADRCVFYVHEGGSLRVTNINANAYSDEYYCHYPVITSFGNVIIDGGNYINYINKSESTTTEYEFGKYVPVRILGGKLTVNGGSFDSQGCAIAAVTDKIEDPAKTVIINNGYFYGAENAVFLNENTTAEINGGFFQTYGSEEKYPAKAVRATGADLTINDGDFRGNVAALAADSVKRLVINDGFFKYTGSATPSSDNPNAAFTMYNSTSNITVRGGEFKGARGITYYNTVFSLVRSFKLSEIVPDTCTVIDEGTGAVDLNTASGGFGKADLIVKESASVIGESTYTINNIKIPFPGEKTETTAETGSDLYTVKLTPMLAVSLADHGIEYTRPYYNFDDGDSYYYVAELIPAEGYKFTSASYSSSTVFNCNSANTQNSYRVIKKQTDNGRMILTLYPCFDESLNYYSPTKGFYIMNDFPYGSNGWYPFKKIYQPQINPIWNNDTQKPCIAVKNVYEKLNNTVGKKMTEWGSPAFQYRITKSGGSTGQWEDIGAINGGTGDFGDLEKLTEYTVEIKNADTDYIYKRVVVKTSSIPGDVDENGVVERADAEMALGYLSTGKPELTAGQKVAASMADGISSFDILDVIAILNAK
ncbi:MAG: hypothetical protein IJR59_05055 [Firmicutes bacterium]|nr:hypothetical protein [Bacillota bacterium]